jgi:hypothetical protein
VTGGILGITPVVGRFELSSKKLGNLSWTGVEGVFWSRGGNALDCCLPRGGHPHIGVGYIASSLTGSQQS